ATRPKVLKCVCVRQREIRGREVVQQPTAQRVQVVRVRGIGGREISLDELCESHLNLLRRVAVRGKGIDRSHAAHEREKRSLVLPKQNGNATEDDFSEAPNRRAYLAGHHHHDYSLGRTIGRTEEGRLDRITKTARFY